MRPKKEMSSLCCSYWSHFLEDWRHGTSVHAVSPCHGETLLAKIWQHGSTTSSSLEDRAGRITCYDGRNIGFWSIFQSPKQLQRKGLVMQQMRFHSLQCASLLLVNFRESLAEKWCQRVISVLWWQSFVHPCTFYVITSTKLMWLFAIYKKIFGLQRGKKKQSRLIDRTPPSLHTVNNSRGALHTQLMWPIENPEFRERAKKTLRAHTP